MTEIDGPAWIGSVEGEIKEAIARAAVKAKTGDGWVIVTSQHGRVRSLQSNALCCGIKLHEHYCSGIDHRGKLVSVPYAEIVRVEVARSPSEIIDTPYKSFPERDDGRLTEDDIMRAHFGLRGEMQKD
jgi:hypothetical protein